MVGMFKKKPKSKQCNIINFIGISGHWPQLELDPVDTGGSSYGNSSVNIKKITVKVLVWCIKIQYIWCLETLLPIEVSDRH